jgi:hypothetical protein
LQKPFPTSQPRSGRRSGQRHQHAKKGYSARDLREVNDSPEWTKEDFAKAKPFAEVFPELAASIRKSGGPNIGTKKR